MRERVRILEMDVDLISLPLAVEKILDWATKRQSCYICVSNVHMCMECHDSPNFRNVVNSADLVVPDGRPLFWMQYLLRYRNASQVRGADLTLALAESAVERKINIGFYGGIPEVLDRLVQVLETRFPGLQIVYRYSPPFRPLSEKELAIEIRRINASGVNILFVGLGCPKQEYWMAQQKGRIHAVMLGVGAAFDFLAGVKPHAPQWMQVIGLEWMFRLLCEPRRLWRRYLILNPRFLLYAFFQLTSTYTQP